MTARYFNTEGLCVPWMHYMVDTTPMIRTIIDEYVDRGKYFTINRARQYGKTTTLSRLEAALKPDHVVIRLSFEGWDDSAMEDLSLFVDAFVSAVARSLDREGLLSAVEETWLSAPRPVTIERFRVHLENLIRAIDVPTVMMIDEIDKSSQSQLVLNFLGMLRTMYLDREDYGSVAFQSVILAGVTDVKRLKSGMRPDGEHRLNSPWNIAATFDVDMSFHPDRIATMLEAYEADHATGMDVAAVAERIYHYTSGYPFLVSALCQAMDVHGLAWSPAGVDEAEIIVVKRDEVSLFDSLMHHLEDADFRAVTRAILLDGAVIPFTSSDPAIGLGRMYGVFVQRDGRTAIANIMFETRLMSYFVSVSATRALVATHVGDADSYVVGGRLDMGRVMSRFSEFMREQYRDRDGSFIEREGRLVFLAFLTPIINGAGTCYLEPETRGGQRMDLAVHYGGEELIVEFKIWHGARRDEQAQHQLAAYVKARGYETGWLLSFTDQRRMPRHDATVKIELEPEGSSSVTIHETVIAYHDTRS